MEWISVKEKPKEWSKVTMKCKDGREVTGIYDPESWITPWIMESGYSDEFERPPITHYKLR